MAARMAKAALVIALCVLTLGAGEPVEVALPAGVFPPEVPADNPVTAERVALGRKLYFDTRLSTDGTVACASCHAPAHGWADPRGATSPGVGGAVGARNAPTVLNAAFLATQFWDGRAATLEEQAVLPLINPIEHGFADHAAVVAKLESLGDYGQFFAAAFGDSAITIVRVGQAIAGFERTVVSVSAPIDRFLRGDTAAISESAQRGWGLYNGKARCSTCHGYVEAIPLFTDDDFHNLGVGATRIDFPAAARKAAAATAAGKSLDELSLSDAEISELGRFSVTREERHLGAFKTPQLRNIALTAPYMHDGSEATLASVIELYDRGGNPNPYLDGGMRPLALTAEEKADLVALLETFTSDDLERLEKLAPPAQ
jgi:cytochrome c peroxidase